MNRIDNSGQGIASLGRDEDQYMAHVAQGEMVVPPVISQETRQRIEQEMKAAGLSPNEYTVGNGMSINPITGQPEFGWLKKTFKSIKKVAKVVAPIAMLVPGVGTALGGVLGGLGGTIGSAFGLKGTLAKGLLGNIAGAGIPGLSNIARGAAGGFPSVTSGLASLFGGAGNQESSFETDEEGNIVGAQIPTNKSSLLQKIFGGGDQDGDSLLQKLFGGVGSVLGNNSKGGGMDPKMFALALALGKATKEAAKEREGGLSQTPEATMDALGRYSMANTLGTGGTREEFGLSAAPKSFSPEVFAAMGGPIDRQYFYEGGLAAIKEKFFPSDEDDGVIVVERRFPKDVYYPYGNPEANISASKDKLYERREEIMDLLEQGYYLRYRGKGKELNEELRAINMELAGNFNQGKTGMTRNARKNNETMRNVLKSLRTGVAMGGPIDRQYFKQGGLAAIAELDMRDGGESDGPGTGTSDDIPAMLSDGEFVMTAKATKGAGAFNVNKTKSGIELISGGKASRKKGVENMRELMDIFEAI
jgi:hypothetical protein|tara:strand:+ start:705 stop:2300 length:1596 start_codon:yes stop_codon:yes gene_type:complete